MIFDLQLGSKIGAQTSFSANHHQKGLPYEDTFWQYPAALPSPSNVDPHDPASKSEKYKFEKIRSLLNYSGSRLTFQYSIEKGPLELPLPVPHPPQLSPFPFSLMMTTFLVSLKLAHCHQVFYATLEGVLVPFLAYHDDPRLLAA